VVRLVPGAREHEPLVQSSALAQPGKLGKNRVPPPKVLRGTCKEFNRAGVVDPYVLNAFREKSSEI
jgi:hypothetical protein